jgi:hypothetical protein
MLFFVDGIKNISDENGRKKFMQNFESPSPSKDQVYEPIQFEIENKSST